MKTVLFACVHNAGRSHMAQAFFNALADPAKARAISAGTRPAASLHPEVVQAMREVGFDLAGARPQALTPGLIRGVDLLVTLGCGEECPWVPGLRRRDWSLPDPKGAPPSAVRLLRESVKRHVEELIAEERWERPSTEPKTAGTTK